eukprot:Awhi_evm1s811
MVFLISLLQSVVVLHSIFATATTTTTRTTTITTITTRAGAKASATPSTDPNQKFAGRAILIDMVTRQPYVENEWILVHDKTTE